MKFKVVKIFCFLFLLAIILDSCKKEKRSNWQTDLLIPIATTSLTLQNIVKDTSKIHTNSDQSLTLSYSSTLYEFNLAEHIVKIPDTSIGQRFNLTDITLPNQAINFKMSLGALALNMLTSPDVTTQFLGNFILANSGNSISFPPLNGLNPAPFHFDATQYFDSAVLTSGRVEIWAVNHMPLPVCCATLELRNTADNSLITSYTMTDTIAPYDSLYIDLQIGGVRITNGLDFYIKNLGTPGTNGQNILVDTSDFFLLQIRISDLHAYEAWAKFPSQNVVDVTEDITQVMGDRKLTYIDARSGFLHIYITSSVDEQLYLEYTLVGAYDKYGNPVKEYTTVPAAPPDSTVTIDRLLDITGTSITLTGKDGSKFNTYTQRVIAHIDSTGGIKHITQADSLSIKYELLNIAPNYMKGYAGTDTIRSVDSAAFGFLDLFKSGSIELEEVNMNFTTENNIGVDGVVKINGLTAVSDNNGSKTLTGSVVGQPFVVHRATDFPLTPVVDYFPINNSNSNIKDLIGILPNKLYYDAEVKTNVNGNNQQYRDFAYLESGLKVKLNAEIPLSLIAHHLVLMDTIAFDLSGTNTNVSGITDGIINVIVQNKYPIDANLTMVIYDENWVAVDTFLANQMIAACDLDNNCKAAAPKRTKIPLYVDEERMNKVKLGKHAVVIADFSTPTNNPTCNGQYLKIYSDYKLDITLTARFNYKVEPGF